MKSHVELGAGPMSARPVQYDAIDTIRCLGYSERQASFIYTVAVHSGYFLRRQFNVAVSGDAAGRGRLLAQSKTCWARSRNSVRAIPPAGSASG